MKFMSEKCKLNYNSATTSDLLIFLRSTLSRVASNNQRCFPIMQLQQSTKWIIKPPGVCTNKGVIKYLREIKAVPSTMGWNKWDAIWADKSRSWEVKVFRLFWEIQSGRKWIISSFIGIIQVNAMRDSSEDDFYYSALCLPAEGTLRWPLEQTRGRITTMK